jgi:hypothetical protein
MDRVIFGNKTTSIVHSGTLDYTKTNSTIQIFGRLLKRYL